jgi:hypothetical protein
MLFLVFSISGEVIQSPVKVVSIDTIDITSDQKENTYFKYKLGRKTAHFRTFEQKLFAIKTNLLYTGLTLSPNIAVEIGLKKHTSIEFAASYNPWNIEGKPGDNKKMVHYLLMPEFKYWLKERFNGHFFGTHLLFSQYNIGGYNLPMLFGKHSDQFRHEGMALGGGFNYGYHRALNSFLAIEATVGVGYLYNKYDQYDAPRCGCIKLKDVQKNYFGPTNLAVSLVFTL